MTKIICDQFGIYSSSKLDFVVKETVHYETALNLIKRWQEEIIKNNLYQNNEELSPNSNIQNSNIEQSDCNIVVRNPAIFHWFDSPARQFDCQIIKLNPVTELKKLIKQSNIPANLNKNPQWILELSLLDKAKNQAILPNENSLMWLQRVLIGEIWQYENLDKNNNFDFNISNLIYWLSTHKKSNLHTFIGTLILDQLEVWGKNHPDKADLFKWLADDPFFRAKLIIWEQYLHKYPQNQIAKWFQHDNIWYTLNLLPNRKKFVPSIDNFLKELQFKSQQEFEQINQQKLKCIINHKPQLPESIALFVRNFLEEEWSRSPQEALSFINGHLEIERQFLLQKLNSHLQNGIALEKDVYDKIVEINNSDRVEISNSDRFTDLIDLADQLIPAKEPSLINPYDSIDKIQQWLKDEYLPFYRSCALLKKLDLTIPYIDSFQEWLKNNYPNLLISGKGMAYSQIYQLKRRLEEKSESSFLIYLFDGLDYLSAKEELIPAFKSMGAYLENDPLPYLAFLPTETFISKPTLVCGLINSQIPPEQPDALFYRQLLQDSLELNQDEIRSATDKDATIQELIQEPAKVYLFLDNQLDREYLHSGLSPYIRLKKYASHLKKQARAIVEAAEFIKNQYNKNLIVSICSDHGYTELPQTVPIINIESTKKIKNRSVLSSDIITNTWKLKSGIFGLNEDMAIPLRYGCFEKRPKGAAHGGCTPQEVAVPWFSITFQKPEQVKPPIITIEGEIFRRRKENLLFIIISNSNSCSISIIDLEIENQAGLVETLTPLPVQIDEKQIIKLQASFNAATVNDTQIQFRGFCTFAPAGHSTLTRGNEKSKIEIQLTVETKGSMTDEFDDDFEW
ncbi:MAG: hypothetical protein HQK73_10210 [Desulfamplus sp.]|nr:hypothetical protein [Desulfamplus sp.]